jgi:hypothetical protein
MSGLRLSHFAGVGAAWLAGCVLPLFMMIEEGRPVNLGSVLWAGAVIALVTPIGWFPGVYVYSAIEGRRETDMYVKSLEREVRDLRKPGPTDGDR